MAKKATFVFGRFNPPTTGHRVLINKMIQDARKRKADPYIVLTHTQDTKKNPLSVKEKRNIMSIIYPEVTIWTTSKEKPKATDIVKRLRNNHYTDIRMMVGSDRAKSFDWVGIPVNSGGQRNNKPGASGMSATKARLAAVTGNTRAFRNSMDPRLSNKKVDIVRGIIKQRIK